MTHRKDLGFSVSGLMMAAKTKTKWLPKTQAVNEERDKDYEADKGAPKSATKSRTGTCNVEWEQDKGRHHVAISLPTHLEWVFIWTRNDTIVVLHYFHTLNF